MSLQVKNLVPQSFKNYGHLIKSLVALQRYGYPAAKLHIIGVTGTDGKTSTSTLIYHLLKSAGKKVALISTVAAYIGDKEIDTGFHVTSPDAASLQKLLKEISDQGFDIVVLEATSHGLHQHRFRGVHFDIGVLTNITHEHLDYHGTYENYLNAKARMFKKVQVAILNKRDQSYAKIKKLINPQATLIAYEPNSLSFKLKQAIKARFPEEYNQSNATAACLAAMQLGVDTAQMIAALKTFPPIPGRMQIIPNTKGITTIVDFAHTPNALANALKALRASTKGKLIAVYGSAGLRDHAKRPLMGKIGSEGADEVILTAEDPRTESVWQIIDQMMSGVTQNHGHMHKIPDRQEAINFAIKLARKGDTVAIFGKGHEKSMCFGTTEYPWSDQEALLRALKG